MAKDFLRIEVENGVGSLILDRPDAMNAFTREMADQLVDLIFTLEQDPAVRCVLFRAEGEAFSAGGDVKGFYEGLTADRASHAAGLERRVFTGHLSMHRIRRMAKPVIIAVQGITAGLGVSLVCCADLAIAADDAQLMLAYRHIGLSVDGGVSYFLPRIVGERRALQITLLGERIDAARALDWGLVNWVVPKADLLSEAMRIAINLANGPTAALGAAKRLFRESLQRSWEEQSADEAFTISRMAATDDHLEGVTAFVEKRKANFTGR